MKFQAVLFDIDGTLLDSGEFIYRAFEHVLAQGGFPLKTRAEIGAVMGLPLPECYRILAGGASRPEALCQEHRNFQKAHLDLPRLYPHTLSTLEKLRAQGLRLAAVTTRSRVSSVLTLERCGIASYLETVVSAEDAVRLKPHPEPLFKALAVLKAEASQAVMVGDTAVDVQAGRNAGTTTVGVTYGFFGERIRAHRPDHVIGDIAELTRILA